MEPHRVFQVLALSDPDTFVWYKYTGSRAKIALKSGDVFYLNRGDHFGLKATANKFHFQAHLDGGLRRCSLNQKVYIALVEEGALLKERSLDAETVGRRIRLSQKTFVPALLKMVNVLGKNGDRSLLQLRVLANTLYALLHTYGVALARVRGVKVSGSVIHDPFVGKLATFLIEGKPVDAIPKTRINGFEMCTVVMPKLKASPLDKESKELFLQAKAALAKLLKTKMNLLLKTLVVNESPQAVIKCNELAKELVLLCAVLSELLCGNQAQARFNAQSLRFTQLS